VYLSDVDDCARRRRAEADLWAATGKEAGETVTIRLLERLA
jgi:hypothetical protein